jgi:8-oxo-dGTP diphosphatase
MIVNALATSDFPALRNTLFRCILKLMEQAVHVFGIRSETLPHTTRAGAYAVMTNAEGLVAAVRGSHGLLLPGGGLEPFETPLEAVHREVREELGRRLTLGDRLGQAIQYFVSDGTCQALYATFYAAELGEVISTTHEHELEWVSADQLFHAHHAWATHKHLRRMAARAHAESASDI